MIQDLRRGLSTLTLALALSAAVAAQTRSTSGDLRGVVYDQSKAVLAGVSVTVANVETGLERTSVSDSDGRYHVRALPPGTYSVRATLPGFIMQERPEVVVLVGATIDLSFTLAVAGQNAHATVTTERPLVDPLKTAVATTISGQQIDSLPINGRNFISFSIITPAVTTDRTPQQGASATSGLTFAGQRARSNNITVDGLDNNDAALGAVRATFSQEAVREFQVLTNSYSAEFGKAAGGVVNIVTKSGTNRISGNGFAYVRNDALNAKEHFEKFDPAGNALDRDKAPYRHTQLGFTIGGPVRRDRSFYFLSFERLDLEANNFVTIDDRTVVTLGGEGLGTPKQILERAGFAVETGNVPYVVGGSQSLVKFDQHVTPAQHVSARFNYAGARNENIEPWGGQIARSRGAALDSRDYVAAVSHAVVGGARFVNELRLQYARRDQDVYALDPRCGGPCDAVDEGGPTLDVTGVASVGRQRFTPQTRHSRRIQIATTSSMDVAGHHVKFGVDASRIDNNNEVSPPNFGGRFIFATALPGSLFGLPFPSISAIQAVALGLPAAYVQGYGNPLLSYRVSDLSLFVQDDWRVSPQLTLKVGARYQSQYWPDVRYDVRGIQPYTFPSDHNNVAPRVAFAWDPWGTKKTSVRGAYGVFFDNHITIINALTDIFDGDQHVRTFVAQAPSPLARLAWNAASRRLPESAVGTYPSLELAIDPTLRTPYAHQASAGIDRQLRNQLALSATVIYARGFAHLGSIDYNPVIPSLGVGRRPQDIAGQAGTSASILQYTSFGETWYRGLALTATKRLKDGSQFFASYTISKAEDNATDFQSAFIPESNGLGRNPENPFGLPIGFDADAERGASVQDQRHRFAFSEVFAAPAGFLISSIVTVASGRPYNILAGVDLNGDGNGGAFPPDRARVNPRDPASSVSRNSGTMPMQATVDIRVSRRFPVRNSIKLEGICEIFNVFNRTNYTEINNVFGTGAYPTDPVPTFGQFTQAAPPRQMQLAVRMTF